MTFTVEGVIAVFPGMKYSLLGQIPDLSKKSGIYVPQLPERHCKSLQRITEILATG